MPPAAIERPSLARRNRGRSRPLISLTPLIDVVFILLVFFMLASSFLDWRAISLDAPATAAAGASMEGALLIEVRADGLRLGGETLSLDALAGRAARQLEKKPDRRVLIRPDTGVDVQRVVAVLDRLAAAGVGNMSLIRDRR